MLVQDIMQRTVVTASPETRFEEIARLLRCRGVRHLPVLDRGALAGIISDRDLKSAMASVGDSAGESASALTAADIMTRRVITTSPVFPVEEAARVMAAERISALPVVDAGRLVGLISETDILLLFVRAMGVLEPSTRLDVVLPAAPRALSQVVHTLETEGAAISSIVTLKSPDGLTEAVIRVATINPGPAVRALESQGYRLRGSWRA